MDQVAAIGSRPAVQVFNFDDASVSSKHLEWAKQIQRLNLSQATTRHTQAYRDSCTIDPRSHKFDVSPGNYLPNDEKQFVYFEIPKSGAAELKFTLLNLVESTIHVQKVRWQACSVSLSQVASMQYESESGGKHAV